MKRIIVLFLLMSLAHATSADSVMDISLRVDGNGFATVEEHYIFES